MKSSIVYLRFLYTFWWICVQAIYICCHIWKRKGVSDFSNPPLSVFRSRFLHSFLLNPSDWLSYLSLFLFLSCVSFSPVRSSIYWHGLTLIVAWTSNYIHYKMCDEINYPFSNFNGCNRRSLGMDKYFRTTLYWAYDYLSMPRFKLTRAFSPFNDKRCLRYPPDDMLFSGGHIRHYWTRKNKRNLLISDIPLP